MSDKYQFDLTELPVVIDSIWDEQDEEVVLTLVVSGDAGVSGYLMLAIEDDDNGEMETIWRWLVNEPEQQTAYSGSENSLMDAAHELKHSMDDMAEFVRERDGK